MPHGGCGGGELAPDARRAILLAATPLTGHTRRTLPAASAHLDCGGPARHAETTCGWGRDTVHAGRNELRSGIPGVEDFESRGRTATEDRDPALENHIRRLVDPHAQADPLFQTPSAHTRVTAKAVREAVLAVPELAGRVPTRQTVGCIPDRLGYGLRRVAKARPPHSPPQTEAIFARVREARAEAAAAPDALRTAIGTKTVVEVGDSSRGGEGRAAARRPCGRDPGRSCRVAVRAATT